MESTFLCCIKLPTRRFLMSPSTQKGHGRRGCSSRKLVNVVNASSRDQWGRLVDENMITLRMRIKEVKMLEADGEDLPADWMEWEKKYFAHYNQDVCEAIGLLQLFLMNTRPSLAIGMLALVALSVPISSYVVIHNAMEMATELLSKL